MAKFQLLGEAPVPTINQNYTTQSTRFGWVSKRYTQPNRWKHLVPLKHWEQWTNKSIVRINREFTKWAGDYWKSTLTTSQRDAWNTVGAVALWENYYGHPNYAGGFELYMITQRLLNYMTFHPYLDNAGISNWYQDTPPDPWNPPASPTIINSTQFDGGEWYAQLGNCPDIHQWVIAAVVAQRRNVSGASRKTSYITAWTNTWTVEPDLAWVSVFLSYPFLPTEVGTVNRLKLGLRWFNFLTLQFSLITWLAL